MLRYADVESILLAEPAAACHAGIGRMAVAVTSIPMKQAALAILVGLGVWAPCLPLCARPLTAERLRQAPDDPANFLIDGRYQRGEALLARMRQHGELPDTLRAGRCRFDLAGDPGVAYYVRTCK